MRKVFQSNEVSPDVAIIELTDSYEVNSHNSPQLREVAIEAINSGHYRLVIDLRRAEFMDSTGLGTLLGVLKRVRAHNGAVVLVVTTERIMKIFRITGHTKIYHIFASTAEALAFIVAAPPPYPKSQTANDPELNSHWVVARVYTSEENAGPFVAASLHDLLDLAGLETVFDFPPERGSWFRESIIRRKDSTARPTRDEILADLARTIEFLAGGKISEHADTATSQAATDFIVTLDKTPDAVIQVYSLLVIKVGDKITARQLSPAELAYWERHPGLARNPGRALRIFRRARSSDPSNAGNPSTGQDIERFLTCQAPSSVQANRNFDVMVRITELRKPGGVAFRLPEIAGTSSPLYVLVDTPPGCKVVSDPVATISLSARGDSDQACFTVRAPRATGQYWLTVRVYGADMRGLELASAQLVITVSRKPTGPLAMTSRPVHSRPSRGAEAHLTVIRSGPARYCYVLNRAGHSPVIDILAMAGDPQSRLRRLAAELGEMTSGGAGWRPAGLRDELRARGGDLWRDFLPGKIREALGELSPGEDTLVLSCQHLALSIPWELMYPIERIGGHSDFLAELFDVVRAPCGTAAWCGEFTFDPALLVLPDGGLPDAAAEARSIRDTLGPAAAEHELVREKARLRGELRGTPFGLLHVTAHHRDKTGTIVMAARQEFSPADLNEFAGDGGAWTGRQPLVFLNACGTARSHQRFTQFTSWAQAFFEAGAGGFVGSMWDVRSDTASAFAQRFYQAIYIDGRPLGGALRAARDHARSLSQDPTWLAYTAHGDPAATVLADGS